MGGTGLGPFCVGTGGLGVMKRGDKSHGIYFWVKMPISTNVRVSMVEKIISQWKHFEKLKK